MAVFFGKTGGGGPFVGAPFLGPPCGGLPVGALFGERGLGRPSKVSPGKLFLPLCFGALIFQELRG